MHESDDRADEPRADKADHSGESAEEAAWREIVENFGERVHLEDESERPAPQPSLEANDGGVPEELVDDPIYLEDVDRYVPPAPPPLPRSSPERAMAWLGVLGSPVAAIVLVIIHSVTGYVFPTWVTAILVVAFLGGFGYLLVTMSKDPGDPWDDGARV